MKITLIGDSIFDNGMYVEKGDSVIEKIQEKMDGAQLLAVDGSLVKDVFSQTQKIDKNTDHIFLSCGGNDALGAASILDEPVKTVGEGVEKLSSVLEGFRRSFRSLLMNLTARYDSNITVCTIYNSVPGLLPREKTALGLFNEVILEEAVEQNISVIDLRTICTDQYDYAEVSPIEPSGIGAEKIAKYIVGVCKNDVRFSKVYG